MLTRSHTGNHTPIDDNLDNDLSAKSLIMDANKLQVNGDLAVPISTSELSEERKYDHFCQLFLATTASNLDSGFYESDVGFLCHWHPSMPVLQQIVIPLSLQCKLCTIDHHYKFGRTPWCHMVACHPTADLLLGADGHWCHLCCPKLHSICEKRVCLRKQASLLELYSAFEPLESVSVDILGSEPKSRRGF